MSDTTPSGQPAAPQSSPDSRTPMPGEPGSALPPQQAGALDPQQAQPVPQQYAQAYAAQPPPFAYPAQPPAPGGFRRGFGLGAGAGLGVGLTFLALGLVGSMISGMMMFALAGSLKGVAQTSVEPLKTVWGADTATKTLRAINVSGAIMADPGDGFTLGSGAYGYEIAQVIDKLQAKDADGLVLLLNTPGGSINGSRAIADAVARYQTRTGKKAFAYVQGMSASGGMYAMAGADKILADHGSLVGSIGIISGPFERYKDVKEITGSMLVPGVATTGGITSEYLTQGTGKDFGNPWRDMTADERAIFMKGLANEYDGFVSWVAAKRKIPAETIKGTLGAHIFDTRTATENKLIDGTAGRDEAFRDFAGVAGLDPAQTRVVTAEAPTMFAQLFGAEARVYGTSMAAVPVGGQPARATASMCTGTPVLLAYQGSLVGVCS